MKRRRNSTRSVGMVLTLWIVLAVSPARGFAEGVHIPLIDGRAAQELADCKALLSSGALPTGLNRLQRMYEAGLQRNALVRAQELTVRTPRYRAVTDTVVDFLSAQPADVLSAYRRLYDPAARASHRRALRSRDPFKLLACFERYPLASTAFESALGAGDLFCERNRLHRALVAWNAIRSDWVPAARRDDWVGRRRLLAALSSDERSRHPSVPPKIDLSSGTVELLWWKGTGMETPRDKRRLRGMLGPEVRHAFVPTVADDWLAIATPWALYRYELQSGWELQSLRFTQRTRYRETSPQWRLQPAMKSDLIVSSYVSSATRQEGRGRSSGVIKAPLPRRALCGISVAPDDDGETVWTTSSSLDESSPVGDLSFNSTPRCVGQSVYALGWRQSGYVDAFLVALDLETGKLLWKTLLVSKQVDLTRFGELASEPLLGEILVEDGVVYACTNLGVMGAVRAIDGRVRWLSEYTPVRRLLPIHRRRRIHYPYHPKTWWERSALLSQGDRIVVTPLDSPAVFAFAKRDGALLGRRTITGSPAFLLGLHDDAVVICVEREVVLIPLLDLDAPGTSYPLLANLQARPALIDGGILYTANGSLLHRSFGDRPPHRSFHRVDVFVKDRETDWQGNPPALEGAVAVHDQLILVANSGGLRCYGVAPRREQPK